MKVEIWSDFVCPFCYMGKRKFEMALEQFEYKDQVEVFYKSFQLDPNSKKRTDKDIHSIIASKYGIPYEQAKENNDGIVAQAKAVGLEYDFEHLIPNNTFLAHRLAKYSEELGKDKLMVERLLKAYFVDSLDIGELEVLVQLASEVGLEEIATREMLQGTSYGDEVIKEHGIGVARGLTGVPFFVINDRYAISGAQPESVFLEVLKEVYEKSSVVEKELEENIRENMKCEDGKCSI